VAGSLTGYQANLHQKIQDIRHLSEGGGALSRFVSMVASLGRDLAVTTDFRDVFGEIVTKHLGLQDARQVFPGFQISEARFPGLFG